MVAAKLRDGHASFVLLQYPDNLFVGETVALHSLVLSMGQSLLQNGLVQWGKVTTGAAGEVMCQGAVVFTGYWNNPDATNSALRNGWFATGDVGYLDDEGLLYLVDRLKDRIISGGENIYPAEVEAFILAHGGIAEVLVVGRPDPRWGEVPVAFAVRKSDVAVAEQDIIDDCRSHLAHFKCPKAVIFLDVLPRNGIGKILKPELRKMAAEMAATV